MVVIENELLPYFTWLFKGTDESMGAIWYFLLFVLIAGFVGLVFGYLVAAVRQGPIAAGDLTYRVMRRAAYELVAVSPRRVWALTKLAVQESIRRRVFVVLGIYIALLGLGSWFLNTELAEPARLQIDIVMTGTNYLMLLMALFLSTFSLPTDIKNRTIYTVVTKPTYAGEIVLGRILGFILTGTFLLAAMGLLSYIFVVRSVSHTHTIDREQFLVSSSQPAKTGETKKEDGSADEKAPDDRDSYVDANTEVSQVTSRDMFHRHELDLDEQGNGIAKSTKGHIHEVHNFEVGPPLDMFQARVPKFGKLTFKSRTGQPESRGISVGSEWDYLSYIEGGTRASAIWTFDNINAAEYPDGGLPIELYLRVYRSYKGNIEKGILGSISVRNPESGLQSEIVQTFRAKDFELDPKFIPRQLKGKRPGETKVGDFDLFDDFVSSDGKIEIELQCLDKAQYYGVAQANLYLRSTNGSFELNFIKGYVGVWTQMVLVICFGVLFSTLLSGPVALVATASCVLLGFFSSFLMDVVTGEAVGGGPFEAMIRTFSQANLTVELEQTAGVVVAKTLDKVALFFMEMWFYILPNFSVYNNINWVADGFNIPADQVWQHITVALSYIFGVYIVGYFFLRLRELGQ